MAKYIGTQLIENTLKNHQEWVLNNRQNLTAILI